MNQNTNDFTQGNIVKKLIQFMIPILGALILQAMYGAVDILVVGKFGTTAGISGVSTGSSVVNLVVFTIAGLAMGVTVLISQYLGEEKPEKIGTIISSAIVLFVSIAAVLTILMLVFARPISILMKAPEDALDLTITYVRICGGGILFIIAYNVISSIFRGLGDSKMPLVFVAIACVVNIVGDLLFVAVLKMNVAGAAIATVLAQAVSVVLSIIIIKKRNLPFKVKGSNVSIRSGIGRILKVGWPIAFQEILTQLSFLALVAFINALGTDASSGYGVANKIVGFVMLVPGALMQSMAAFVAQNVGAGKEERAKKTMVTGMALGGSIGVVIGLLTFFQGDALANLFANDPQVITRAFEYLRGFAPEAVVTAILFSFIGYFNGHGQTLWVMIQGISQSFLVRIPMSYIMSIQPNADLTRIGLAAPSATVFGILINLCYYYWYTRKMRREEVF